MVLTSSIVTLVWTGLSECHEACLEIVLSSLLLSIKGNGYPFAHPALYPIRDSVNKANYNMNVV
jgi:hypothetical protein